MPDCSSPKPPPRGRLSDQTIAAVQVLTPVTWGFRFANRRLSSQLSVFTLPYCGRISDAAILHMLPQCSSQWDELPNCIDTPIVRLAASPTACNGVEAALVCPNVSIVAIPSRTNERGIAMLFSKGFAASVSLFPTTLSSGLVFVYITRQTKPEPWM